MGDYTLARTVQATYEQTVENVKAGLVEQGFGVLTEIDLAATLRAKIGATVPPQLILGACRPQLAYEAIQADPSIAALLPCNVVVRSLDEHTTLVEAFDPLAMVGFVTGPTDGPTNGGGDSGADSPVNPVTRVANDARERLNALLANLA